MRNLEEDKAMFNATLSLKRNPISAKQLNRNLIRFPFMTGKVFAGIYWNALKLYLKKIPFYPHPRKLAKSQLEVQAEKPTGILPRSKKAV